MKEDRQTFQETKASIGQERALKATYVWWPVHWSRSKEGGDLPSYQ